MKKRVRVHYSGMVQGVGFRLTVQRLAASLAIDGFVKNLPDGRVEVVAEGTDEKLERFTAGIKDGVLSRYIKDIAIDREEATGEFFDFDIRF